MRQRGVQLLQRRLLPKQGASLINVRTLAAGERLFDKILIANRGEIACRVMRTCKKLGIKTVAVYSEADRNSVHVKMADEAVCVGPAPSVQSYLNIPAIVEAARKTGAQAVHPGYGFLSEKIEFLDALEKENIVFIGPQRHAFRAMADKITAKTVARKAGVSTVPGNLSLQSTPEEIVKMANEIGYPVMIKASEGGGGKGMRIAWNDEEARIGFRLSLAEAKSSFNSDKIFVEKYIEEPRHIEIQVLGDSHGNYVYLFERECSIQRRNQKIIEEAPSTFLDPATRKAMGEQAVALARAVGYQSAGTCEFLVDKNRNFYFLEMNTRLQVEHPVTELVTGVDLVEQMIRVAAGHKLPFRQEDLSMKGWAIEARVYAEDPLRDFLPSIGKLKRYIEPRGEGIRCDSGVEEGSEISIYYDPMICKLITYGKDRAEALQRLRGALDSYVIRGVTHNINFLRALTDHPRWISGDINTKFIPDEYPEGFKGHILNEQDKHVLAAGAVIIASRIIHTQVSLNSHVSTFNPAEFHKERLSELVVQIGEEKFNLQVTVNEITNTSQKLTATVTGPDANAKPVTLSISSGYKRGDLVFDVYVNGVPTRLQALSISDGMPTYSIQLKGTEYPVTVFNKRQAELFPIMPVIPKLDTTKLIVSPMPGQVYSISVNVGDKVAPGQEVCVVEAMKMQNALRAVAGGVVKAIKVKVGQAVSRDQILVEFE